MTKKRWLAAVGFFFVWGFVLHAAGLVLHEVGGHGLAGITLGCGIGGIDLTYFGHGVLHYVSPCSRWTWTKIVIANWSGLVVTIAAGAVAMWLARRATFAPITRLLLAILGTGFLLGQLAYATSGGFADLYDPALTARTLGEHGLHVLAWLPPFVLFAASAFVGAWTVTTAFREHFGSRSPLHALGQMVATLGVSGALYFVAFRIEWTIRTDLWMRGVAHEAERLAVVRHEAPPFPIERVLWALAFLAFALAFARPVQAPSSSDGAIPKRHVRIVATAALVCFVAVTLLERV